MLLPNFAIPRGDVGQTGSAGANGTNGASFSITTPSAGSVTSGTAFQPSATNHTFVLVSASLASAISLTGTVKVEIAPTSGGAYVQVGGLMTMLTMLALLGTATEEKAFFVPLGYYVKVTAGAGILSGITLTKTVWSL